LFKCHTSFKKFSEVNYLIFKELISGTLFAVWYMKTNKLVKGQKRKVFAVKIHFGQTSGEKAFFYKNLINFP